MIRATAFMAFKDYFAFYSWLIDNLEYESYYLNDVFNFYIIYYYYKGEKNTL